MRTLLLICISTIAFIIIANAQHKHDNNWMYGYGGGSVTSPGGNYAINFDADTVTFIRNDSEMSIHAANATMSNANGELVFYTNGCWVANAAHELMENGDSLNLGFIYDDFCVEGYGYAAVQTMLALPMPEDSTKYMLIHKTYDYQEEPFFDVFTTKLLYTMIDMNGNNGLGIVVEKNQPIWANDTIDTGNLVATKHENGVDWWILSSRYDDQSDYYRAFLLTAEGIVDTVEQTIGAISTFGGSGSGQSTFSPDGSLYVRNNEKQGVYLYDFDRNTGLLSNFRHLLPEEQSELNLGGNAISSNNRFLYVASFPYVFQFDLWEETEEGIQNSKTLVAEYDGFQDPFPTNFYQMQLAPDCRIYIGSTNGVKHLHVINNPNEKGAACNLYQHRLELPTPHYISMPYFPHYRTDTEMEICDSTIQLSMLMTSIDAVDLLSDQEPKDLKIMPNPSNGQVTIALPAAFEQRRVKGTLYLTDWTGKQVGEYKVTTSRLELNLGHLPKGVYISTLVLSDKTFFSGKIILQ